MDQILWRRKLKAWAFVLLAICFGLSIYIVSLLTETTHAQLPSQIELACPAGSNPMPGGVVNDNPTTLQRQWLCVDVFGNVFIQGLGAAPGVGGGTGGGSGPGSGGTGGGSGSPGTTWQPVPPSVAFMGPGQNSINGVFDGQSGNVGTANTSKITYTPTLTNDLAFFLTATSTTSANPTNPAGFTNQQSSSRSDVSFRALTASSSFSAASNSSVSDFFATGGFLLNTSVTPVRVQTVATASGILSFPAPTVIGTATTTANNTLVVTLVGVSNSGFTQNFSGTITDNVGNIYTPVLVYQRQIGASSPFVAAWVSNNIAGGSTAVSITLNQANINAISLQVSEWSGIATLNTGSAIPAFRLIQASDLPTSVGFPVAAFGSSILSADVTITTTATTITSVALTAPPTGCPCRAYVSYSLFQNYTGVTNEPDQDFWISDGTVTFAGLVTGQSNASTGGVTSASYSGFSEVTYNNSQAVTFTLLGIDSAVNAGTQTFLVKAVPPTGAGPHSKLQVAFIASK